jgi:hypothetical protein
MPWKTIEARRAYFRRRYATDPEFRRKHIERSANRNATQREHHNEVSRRRNRKLKIEAVSRYGSVCACCGESILEFLAIDHEAGGGNEHRKAIGIFGGVEFYRWLKAHNWPAGFRVLCHNCNMAIGIWGFCPHEKYHGDEHESI